MRLILGGDGLRSDRWLHEWTKGQRDRWVNKLINGKMYLIGMIAGGNEKFIQMSIAGSLRFRQYFSSFISLRFIGVEVTNDYRNVRAYISFVLSSNCLLIHLFICYFICLSIRLFCFTFFFPVRLSINPITQISNVPPTLLSTITATYPAREASPFLQTNSTPNSAVVRRTIIVAY